ncbi:MAG: methionyl-tRNA formyltransferase, partial [Planctomycetes bacterium]|nr:methionyl-tRNA formyltransferase [Planctomycetota bacterium]
MDKIKMIFMGNGDFGALILNGIINSNSTTIAGVITTPDKSKGRSRKILPNKVKKISLLSNQNIIETEQ